MAVLSKPFISGLVGLSLVSSLLWHVGRSALSRKPKEVVGVRKDSLGKKKIQDSAQVNAAFFKKLLYILKTLLPRWWCKETILMTALMFALLGRTWMSLWIASNLGKGVEYVCNRQWKKGVINTIYFALMTTFAALINASLKYLQASLGLSLRNRFVAKAHAEYMLRNNYYRVNKLGSEDTRLELTDQLMTEDIKRWSFAFAEVYSAVFKPVVDFFLFSYKLASMMGVEGPLGMYAWFGIATVVTTLSLPPYGKLLAVEQEFEGKFREAHQKLIQNSEMVAFMAGEIPEEKYLNERYGLIKGHISFSNWLRFKSDLVMGYVNKYFASVIGFLLMARPIYFGERGLGNADAAGIAAHYVASRQIMENLSNAVLALFEVQKKIGNLSGLTMRVNELLTKLKSSEKIFEEFVSNCPNPTFAPKVVDSTDLKFENVTVYRPDGHLLGKYLNFEVPHMRRVMITGPNGCGKSSLFRILRGLWPLTEGTIHRPKDSDVYFLSQVNFVPRGTLRELLTYPHSAETLQQKNVSDESLWKCLELAHLMDDLGELGSLTLDTVLDWEVALSPGQKQRMAFARLLYHRPRYAILDECTNGISPDVEADLYQRCAAFGISVFSISHKEDLKKYHDYELHYIHDAAGSYQWNKLDKKLLQSASQVEEKVQEPAKAV